MSRRKILLLMVILAVGLCVAAYICVRLAASLGDNSIARIGSSKISLAEFCVYLRDKKIAFERLGGVEIWDIDFDGETSAEVAKQSTLNSIMHVKITCQQAPKEHVALSPEELASAKKRATETYEGYPREFIEYSRVTPELLEKIVAETTLYNKMQIEVTRDIEVSEIAFQDYYTKTYLAGGEILSDGEDIETVREKYLQMKKQEFFNSEYEKWAYNVQTVKNQNLWDEISIEDIK